ncbi:BrnT family toxin [Devosia sp.]|uniref:BrnT family toxin n=1 Tax=Devosia sp. TaxID=1871048 RepID=UPI003BAA08BA
MKLEWDEEKRQDALRERQLDFADVEKFDPDSLDTLEDKRFDYGERRYITYGHLDGRLCLYCWTWRGSRMRVISMRKANDRELKSYQARQASRHT